MEEVVEVKCLSGPLGHSLLERPVKWVAAVGVWRPI
jgi:hypothetical protein